MIRFKPYYEDIFKPVEPDEQLDRRYNYIIQQVEDLNIKNYVNVGIPEALIDDIINMVIESLTDLSIDTMMDIVYWMWEDHDQVMTWKMFENEYIHHKYHVDMEDSTLENIYIIMSKYIPIWPGEIEEE